MVPAKTVTLLTDFGGADYFVGAMKGVLLSSDPEINIVDLTHEVPRHDITSAAFILLACYSDFPAGTIHLAIVDPGVGSKRRPIAIVLDSYAFIGPDNGVFSFVLDRHPDAQIVHLTKEGYFKANPSATFHGRDIFAPVAAALARGVPIGQLGEPISDPIRLEMRAECQRSADGCWNAVILHIDHFGNCVTSIPRETWASVVPVDLRIEINGQTIRKLRSYYADAADAHGELFAIWGSAGFLEISAFDDSAAQRLQVKPGERVRFTWRA